MLAPLKIGNYLWAVSCVDIVMRGRIPSSEDRVAYQNTPVFPRRTDVRGDTFFSAVHAWGYLMEGCLMRERAACLEDRAG